MYTEAFIEIYITYTSKKYFSLINKSKLNLYYDYMYIFNIAPLFWKSLKSFLKNLEGSTLSSKPSINDLNICI